MPRLSDHLNFSLPRLLLNKFQMVFASRGRFPTYASGGDHGCPAWRATRGEHTRFCGHVPMASLVATNLGNGSETST